MIDLARRALSVSVRDTWLTIPFRLPFEVICMPSAIAVLEIEVSTNVAAKLSFYVNKTTITASKFVQPPIADASARTRSRHETFKFEVPMRCLRSEN